MVIKEERQAQKARIAESRNRKNLAAYYRNQHIITKGFGLEYKLKCRNQSEKQDLNNKNHIAEQVIAQVPQINRSEPNFRRG